MGVGRESRRLSTVFPLHQRGCRQAKLNTLFLHLLSCSIPNTDINHTKELLLFYLFQHHWTQGLGWSERLGKVTHPQSNPPLY
jgi:hypothetical protein